MKCIVAMALLVFLIITIRINGQQAEGISNVGGNGTPIKSTSISDSRLSDEIKKAKDIRKERQQTARQKRLQQIKEKKKKKNGKQSGGGLSFLDAYSTYVWFG